MKFCINYQSFASNVSIDYIIFHINGIFDIKGIDNAMDGVAGLTQDAGPPGGNFDYSFSAPDAGTFWYHPHFRTWEQLARGLYGLLIVEEDEPPEEAEEARERAAAEEEDWLAEAIEQLLQQAAADAAAELS